MRHLEALAHVHARLFGSGGPTHDICMQVLLEGWLQALRLETDSGSYPGRKAES